MIDICRNAGPKQSDIPSTLNVDSNVSDSRLRAGEHRATMRHHSTYRPLGEESHQTLYINNGVTASHSKFQETVHKLTTRKSVYS